MPAEPNPARELPVEDGRCPARMDKSHCPCWWDDSGPCCACGDDALPANSDTRDKEGNRVG